LVVKLNEKELARGIGKLFARPNKLKKNIIFAKKYDWGMTLANLENIYKL